MREGSDLCLNASSRATPKIAEVIANLGLRILLGDSYNSLTRCVRLPLCDCYRLE